MLRGRPLADDEADEVLKHLGRLWGFTVRLESVDGEGGASKVRECVVPQRQQPKRCSTINSRVSRKECRLALTAGTARTTRQDILTPRSITGPESTQKI